MRYDELPVLGTEQVGNKELSWNYRCGGGGYRSAHIYATGTVGPRVCYSMEMTPRGSVKARSHGSNKFTLEQHEWIVHKCISLFRS